MNFTIPPLIFVRILFLCAVLSVFNVARAQSIVPQDPDTRYGQPPSLRFEHISLEQGLSQSTVYAVVQDRLGFMWFGTQDGLNRFDGYSIAVYKHRADDSASISDNGIWCMLGDRNGDLWIGTMRGGLNHYSITTDKFTSYRHDPANPHSISENNVTSLFEDSRGTLWVGTLSKGLEQFDRETRTFTRYNYNPADPHSLVDSTVWSICEDAKRNLWVGTWSGLCKLSLRDSGTAAPHFVRYAASKTDPASLSGNNVQTLLVDRHGTLWVGTRGSGLNRYEERTNSFRHYRTVPGDPHSLSSDQILSLYEDSRGNLWVGTGDGGLNLYDQDTDRFLVFRHDPNNPASLSSDIVAAIREDRTGALWIGTGAAGVNRYDRTKDRFVHVRDDPANPDDLPWNDVWAITEDTGGSLWIGTYGKGIARYDRGTHKFIRYGRVAGDNRGPSHNNILSACATRDGDVWFGTEGGGLNRFDHSTGRFVVYHKKAGKSDAPDGDEVTRILEDSQGFLWIGTNGYGVDRFDRKQKTFRHYKPEEGNNASVSGTSVMALYEDRDGYVWVGTWGGGVSRYDRKTDSFVRFLNIPDDMRSLNNNTVLSIYQDREGAMWLGTYGGGLNRYDPNTRTFTHYTEDDGLPNNVVYGVLPDHADNLWLSTNKGLSRFNLSTRTFRNYDVKDGLQGNEFNMGAYYGSKSGRLFFGGINGLNVFHPDSIHDNADVPPVVLTSFKVFDMPVALDRSILATDVVHLAYDQNFFSVEFVALSFVAPDKNRYAYKLEGLDENWVNAGTRRFANYTNIDPGTYTLRVKGSNNDGVWNEKGVTLTIIIPPPYYKTWWFRGVVFAFVALALFLMYRYRVKKLLEIERIRTSIATDLHDDIGSTLTEIALFSDVGIREIRSLSPGKPITGAEAEKVTSLLEEIGHTSRTLIDSMNDIVWAIDPKNDSFEFLLLRMKTHAARMFDARGINYDIEIPSELSELELPLGFRRRFFLIFKEAINNIIKHAHPTKVQLTLAKERSALVMSITDNGVGFDARVASEGNGLRNMDARATALGGTLSITSARAGGTSITLRAPIP